MDDPTAAGVVTRRDGAVEVSPLGTSLSLSGAPQASANKKEVGGGDGAGGGATGQPTKKRKFVHTTEAQRRSMVEWLELPGNFQLLASPSGSATADGKKIKKTDGFRALMRYVNLHTGAAWPMDVTKSRFESLLTSYRKVKRQAQQGVFALTESDRARGITDVTQKLTALCLFYDRIDALYEPKPMAPAQEPLADSVEEEENQPGVTDDHESMVLSAENVTSPGGGEASPSYALDEPNEDGNQQDAVSTEVAPDDIEQQEDRGEIVTDDNELPAMISAEPPADDTTASPMLSSPSAAPSDEGALRQQALEHAHLLLLQEQLAVQKHELEMKERELKQQQDTQRVAMRADLAVKLAQAGKSVAEIKELLQLIIS